MKRILIVIMTIITVQLIFAQTITVENFKHLKKPPLPFLFQPSFSTDKNFAILDFITDKKGFTFTDAKENPIEFEEGEGVISLKLAPDSKYIRIQHEDFGQAVYRVPVKSLKKNQHYQATLIAADMTKEFNNPMQWVVFNIGPHNSIATVDSTLYQLRNGTLELYLPVGKHTYLIESPYFEAQSAEFELNDSSRLDIEVRLQPIEELQAYYLMENFEEEENDSLNNNSATKKLTNKDKDGFLTGGVQFNEDEENRENKNLDVVSEVHLIAETEDMEIWIDREYKGTGEWKGMLEEGFHYLNTEKNGVESVSQYIEITDNFPREILLAVPRSSLGMVNVTSNVTGAEIILGNEIAGQTPAIIKDLKADEQHTILLRKEGYRDIRVSVRPRGNDVTDLYIKMKKK